MGLFDFFRRKSGESLYLEGETEAISVLNVGILFEDNKKLLKWGVAVSDLAKQVEVKEKRFADRTVYSWGEHTIIDGLKLQLYTVYWDYKADSGDKRFNWIESQVDGDDPAGNLFRLIGTHLEAKFGPGRHIEGEPDGCFEWYINEIRISLCLLERVANKLLFKIEKI